MNRRESMKSMLIGSMAGGMLINGCSPKTGDVTEQNTKYYGRTPGEIELDNNLFASQFFTVHELETVVDLCDLILPPQEDKGSAFDAGVPEFIEFIAKDMPQHQLPIRGGIMWIDNQANGRFNKLFKSCNAIEQKQILDDIAYPDKVVPMYAQGAKFFALMRNLTLTGYYTSPMGLKELGYKGNQPNVWDGVPKEVLKEHGLSYDEDWLAKCIDHTTRDDPAYWDDQGNLMN